MKSLLLVSLLLSTVLCTLAVTVTTSYASDSATHVKPVADHMDLSPEELVAYMEECNVQLGFVCAGAIAGCALPCKEFLQNPQSCLSCLGASVGTCCPCLKKAFGPNFPC